ncbi:MAG: hypothetical protein PWQ79_287 [Thermococcaceae archaeon]|nr:hypothetical protein [Thermococcaceae archaeon]MDK2913372.1 hypothetical protein [Thermococcaceae archaeon]
MEIDRFVARNGRMTSALFFVNIGVYVLEAVLSRNPLFISTAVLLRWGQWNYAVIHYGWWWQLFTAMFVHVNLIHLAFNTYFLLIIGRQVEAALGSRRLLGIYLISGLTGNLLTLLFLPPNSVSAGASGALFGMVGTLIVMMGVIGGDVQRAILNALILFLINSIFPGVNAVAHFGGLAVGAALGYYYGKKARRRILAMYYGYLP